MGDIGNLGQQNTHVRSMRNKATEGLEFLKSHEVWGFGLCKGQLADAPDSEWW